jgi:23S rRNA (guanosine2251-2'-O)-methyltransferase
MESNTSKIFGLRTIIEAIQAGTTIGKIYLQKGLQGGSLFTALADLIKQHQIPTSMVPVEKLNHLSKQGNHQGAVARISPVTFTPLDELIEKILDSDVIPLFLVLDGITDVRNVGAIIRTAECTGVHGIVIPKHGSAPINADTIKTSAGAAFKIPLARVEHIKDALYQFQACDFQLIGATEKTENLIYDVNLKKPTVIILGSEDKGINPSVLKMTTKHVKLPLLGEIASLNVSVACGAILYEAVRQRNT